MDAALLDKLRQSIRKEVAEKLASGDLPSVGDGLYVLGVFIVNDGPSSYVSLYHNVNEDDESGEVEVDELADRWTPSEWGTVEPIAEESFQAFVKSYRLDSLSNGSRDKAYSELMTYATGAAIRALKDLDAAGTFGSPPERAQVTLLAGQMDGEEVTEDVSLVVGVRQLNDKRLADKFLSDWTQIVEHYLDDKDWLTRVSQEADASPLQKAITG